MSFSVSSVSRDELGEACRLLATRRPPSDRGQAGERYGRLFESGELDAQGLFVAKDESSTIRGVMLVQSMPGALGLAWPPRCATRNRIAIEDALVDSACRWLQSRGVKVCQAFGSEVDGEPFGALERNGFRQVTELIDFRCKLPSMAPVRSFLSFEPVNAANGDTFSRLLLETFEGSLDCPEVAGSRNESELLESYTTCDAKRDWFLVNDGTTSIGVVLLLPIGDRRMELTYLGLSKKNRGRGCGAELLRFALNHSRNVGAEVLELSVDSRNAPALALYQTHGFEASGTRAVFLADWSAIS